MRNDKLAAQGALGGGALSTVLVFVSGCLGAKVLLLLGVSAGAMGWLSSLEPYRIPLAVLGLAAFAFGGWRIYRRRVAATSSA